MILDLRSLNFQMTNSTYILLPLEIESHIFSFLNIKEFRHINKYYQKKAQHRMDVAVSKIQKMYRSKKIDIQTYFNQSMTRRTILRLYIAKTKNIDDLHQFMLSCIDELGGNVYDEEFDLSYGYKKCDYTARLFINFFKTRLSHIDDLIKCGII
jgi:hypothetical protein